MKRDLESFVGHLTKEETVEIARIAFDNLSSEEQAKFLERYKADISVLMGWEVD